MSNATIRAKVCHPSAKKLLKSLTMDTTNEQPATQLLGRVQDGDKLAADQLIGLVYGELHALAAAHLRQEPAGHTLQATSLVHEVFLKLVDQERVDWRGRTHFLAVGAQAMRRILVDHARGRNRHKRGRGWKRAKLDDLLTISRCSLDDVFSVHEALNELQELSPRQASIVELRFFAGMTATEVSEHMGISKATVDREWRFARAWLRKALTEDVDH